LLHKSDCSVEITGSGVGGRRKNGKRWRRGRRWAETKQNKSVKGTFPFPLDATKRPLVLPKKSKNPFFVSM
jgi:hypothetical protein